MFMKHDQIAPARISSLLQAAEAAARAIPPAFPLEATVAVNPFLGQTGEDLATATARLARVAGVALTRPRAEYAAGIRQGRITDDDLAAALIASALAPEARDDLALLKAKAEDNWHSRPSALPTVADLAAEGNGNRLAFGDRTDLRPVGGRPFRPGPGALVARRRARAAYRRLASLGRPRPHSGNRGADRLLRACGICAGHGGTRDPARRRRGSASPKPPPKPRSTGCCMDLGGWAQHARWLLWQAELDGRSDARAARPSGDPPGLGRGAPRTVSADRDEVARDRGGP